MIIVGAGEFGQVIQYYTGAKLCAHREFAKDGIAVFEEEKPTTVLVCIGDNYARKRVMDEAVERGHKLTLWIHHKAYVDAVISSNSFVFDYNNFQPYSTFGRNCVFWSGNHIGHHARIGNHCFITSHVCIGGRAVIGDSCFIGMNATVFDHVTIGNDCVIAAGAVVDRDIPAGHTLSRKGVLVANDRT